MGRRDRLRGSLPVSMMLLVYLWRTWQLRRAARE